MSSLFMLVDKISNFNTHTALVKHWQLVAMCALTSTLLAPSMTSLAPRPSRIFFFSDRETGYWEKFCGMRDIYNIFFSHWVDGCFWYTSGCEHLSSVTCFPEYQNFPSQIIPLIFETSCNRPPLARKRPRSLLEIKTWTFLLFLISVSDQWIDHWTKTG